MTVRVHFDGKVFVPDEPVDLPVGQPLEIISVTIVDEKPKGTLAELAEWAKKLPGDPNSPTDGAAEHDHYLYGTPKRYS